MVHLVDDQVSGRLHDRSLVTVPMLGVGLIHIDDDTSFAVYTHGLGKDTGTLAVPSVEGVETPLQVTLDASRPKAVSILHL